MKHRLEGNHANHKRKKYRTKEEKEAKKRRREQQARKHANKKNYNLKRVESIHEDAVLYGCDPRRSNILACVDEKGKVKNTEQQDLSILFSSYKEQEEIGQVKEEGKNSRDRKRSKTVMCCYICCFSRACTVLFGSEAKINHLLQSKQSEEIEMGFLPDETKVY